MKNALLSPAVQKFESLVYEPKKPKVIYRKDREPLYNIWNGVALVPKEGDVSTFLDHCKFMVPNEYERNVFLNFLAYNIQYQGNKIHWALLLKGGQGTGKSYFGYVMRLSLGNL